jgi:hypothetical protein
LGDFIEKRGLKYAHEIELGHLTGLVITTAAQQVNGQGIVNILNAFKNEVEAQSGKHITDIAVQLLLQDADSLISEYQ